MIMKQKYFILYTLIFLFTAAGLAGQKNAEYYYSDQDLYEGIELFEKQKYGAARNKLEQLIEQTEGSETQLRAEAMYYYAMSAILLYNRDAEYQAYRFIAEHPESPHVTEVCSLLGNYFHY